MAASKNGINVAVTPSQVRAARALICWSQDELVAASRVPKRTVARLEIGEGSPRPATLSAIRSALETAGVEFIAENGGGVGVRLKSPS